MVEREYWFWWVTSERTGKRVQTRHRMTRETALETDPTAEPVALSREVRRCPTTDREMVLACTDSFMNLPLLRAAAADDDQSPPR